MIYYIDALKVIKNDERMFRFQEIMHKLSVTSTNSIYYLNIDIFMTECAAADCQAPVIGFGQLLNCIKNPRNFI